MVDASLLSMGSHVLGAMPRLVIQILLSALLIGLGFGLDIPTLYIIGFSLLGASVLDFGIRMFFANKKVKKYQKFIDFANQVEDPSTPNPNEQQTQEILEMVKDLDDDQKEMIMNAANDEYDDGIGLEYQRLAKAFEVISNFAVPTNNASMSSANNSSSLMASSGMQANNLSEPPMQQQLTGASSTANVATQLPSQSFNNPISFAQTSGAVAPVTATSNNASSFQNVNTSGPYRKSFREDLQERGPFEMIQDFASKLNTPNAVPTDLNLVNLFYKTQKAPYRMESCLALRAVEGEVFPDSEKYKAYGQAMQTLHAYLQSKGKALRIGAFNCNSSDTVDNILRQ